MDLRTTQAESCCEAKDLQGLLEQRGERQREIV